MPFAMQQLIAAAVTLFATAPPALLSLPRTSAAVPELLFGILLLHASVSETPTHRCKRPQPGKLVHHHASTRIDEALPSTLRCAANATRHTLPARGRVRNPHREKNRWPIGKSTRALACRANGQQPSRNAAPADAVAETHLHRRAAPGSPCALLPSPTSVGRGTRIDVGLPRSCPQRRHHCRAHGPERHRRQDV